MNHSDITSTYSVIVSLFHALELLERQGLYPFISFFFDNGHQKYFVSLDPELKTFLTKTQQDYAQCNPLEPDQSLSEEYLTDSAKNLISIQGHPKYSILAERLTEFYDENPDSKVKYILLIIISYR